LPQQNIVDRVKVSFVQEDTAL